MSSKTEVTAPFYVALDTALGETFAVCQRIYDSRMAEDLAGSIRQYQVLILLAQRHVSHLQRLGQDLVASEARPPAEKDAIAGGVHRALENLRSPEERERLRLRSALPTEAAQGGPSANAPAKPASPRVCQTCRHWRKPRGRGYQKRRCTCDESPRANLVTGAAETCDHWGLR